MRVKKTMRATIKRALREAKDVIDNPGIFTKEFISKLRSAHHDLSSLLENRQVDNFSLMYSEQHKRFNELNLLVIDYRDNPNGSFYKFFSIAKAQSVTLLDEKYKNNETETKRINGHISILDKFISGDVPYERNFDTWIDINSNHHKIMNYFIGKLANISGQDIASLPIPTEEQNIVTEHTNSEKGVEDGQ